MLFCIAGLYLIKFYKKLYLLTIQELFILNDE